MTPQGSGGIVGNLVASALEGLLGLLGGSVAALTLLVAALPLALLFSWGNVLDGIGGAVLGLWRWHRTPADEVFPGEDAEFVGVGEPLTVGVARVPVALGDEAPAAARTTRRGAPGALPLATDPGVGTVATMPDTAGPGSGPSLPLWDNLALGEVYPAGEPVEPVYPPAATFSAGTGAPETTLPTLFAPLVLPEAGPPPLYANRPVSGAATPTPSAFPTPALASSAPVSSAPASSPAVLTTSSAFLAGRIPAQPLLGRPLSQNEPAKAPPPPVADEPVPPTPAARQRMRLAAAVTPLAPAGATALPLPLADLPAVLPVAHVPPILASRDEPPPWDAGSDEAEEVFIRDPDVRSATVVAPASVQPNRPEPPSSSSIQPVAPARLDGDGLAGRNLAGEPGLPSLDLLDDPRPGGRRYTVGELNALSRELERHLKDFGVKVTVVNAIPGPVITRFELAPAPGVKGVQITNLSNDLARALSVSRVRVIEVIEGKPYVGLELPNPQREMVGLKEIFAHLSYAEAKSPLTLGLGKDIGGTPASTDLARMPHLLVAGTTGSGKSVAVNAMILSMLFKATPQEVRFIFIDPKMLELSVYEGIPHLLSPVITDMKDAANALRWSVNEMERRYKLMSALGVRNLAGMNQKIRDAEEAGKPLADPIQTGLAADGSALVPEVLEPMHHIVIVIDELADLMMQVGKKVEELIARLAQKARAAGIHLIVATQRPSVDVITGLIKANVPSRVAFQVASRIDSRTILDAQGAETLLGHGDMLFKPVGANQPVRLHGAFVDDPEVHRVVAYLKTTGRPQYIPSICHDEEAEQAEVPELDSDVEVDPVYDQAVAIVVETRRASVSWIQRKLKIGYNRAARIVEHMESVGLVGPAGPGGNRDILAPAPSRD